MRHVKEPVNPCDVCGRPTAASDCVETIEEWLCQSCASGIDEDDYDGDEFDDWEEDEMDFPDCINGEDTP